MLSTNDNPQISLLLFECCLLLSQWLAKSKINFDLLGSAQSRSYVGPLEGLGSHQIFPERQNLWVQFGFCAWPSWRKKCYTTTKWSKALRYRNTMAIPFMPILDSTKQFLATSKCTKSTRVVKQLRSPFRCDYQPSTSGVPKKSWLASEKWEKTGSSKSKLSTVGKNGGWLETVAMKVS